MSSESQALVQRFSRLNVLVLGDAMLDRYVRGTTQRLCREAPVPIIDVREVEVAPGGAANTAANLAALGASVVLLSAIGDDAEGRELLDCLRAHGVIVDQIQLVRDRKSLAKQRVLAGGQLMLRFDTGTTTPVGSSTEASLIGALTALHGACDAVVISDYGYGVLTDGVIGALEALQQESPRPLFCDAKDFTRYAALKPTAVKPNYSEAIELMKDTAPRAEASRSQRVAAGAERLLEVTGARVVAVSLDVEGVLLLQRDASPRHITGDMWTTARAAGAGDSFVAAFALSLVAGASPDQAAQVATIAAGIAVRRDGTAMCRSEQLVAELRSAGRCDVMDCDELVAILARERARGKRIVFTNGCFDIVHSGHTRFLAEARSQGDVLVVGLNSDESVRRLKGEDRPVNSLADRAQVLMALSCVDYVVPFDDDTPEDLIAIVRPDVYAKGGDYTRDTLPEAGQVEALGGVVRILDYLEDRSTTSLIARIRRRDAEPVASLMQGDA